MGVAASVAPFGYLEGDDEVVVDAECVGVLFGSLPTSLQPVLLAVLLATGMTECGTLLYF